MKDNTEHDRGAFSELRFQRCERGFILMAQRHVGELGSMFAFDRIEDLAAWLVGQYREDPKACQHERLIAGGDGPAQCLTCGATVSATEAG